MSDICIAQAQCTAHGRAGRLRRLVSAVAQLPGRTIAALMPRPKCEHRLPSWGPTPSLRRTITGVGLYWDGRPRLAATWTGACQYCGETCSEDGLVPSNCMPAGFTLDTNGWPLAPDGTRFPMKLDAADRRP